MTSAIATLAIFIAYPLAILASGLLLRRRSAPQGHLLHAHRSLSLGMVSLAFLASNCSALEVVGMTGLAAKYGILAVHFYWIGAIPALAFLLVVLLPRYQALQLRSVPQFLGQRFTTSTQVFSALSFTFLMMVVAGITLGLESRILHLALGLNLSAGVCLGALLVAAFLLTGGLRAVIYAEALQLLIFLLVLAPLAFLTLRQNGGIHSTLTALPDWQQHALNHLPAVSPRAPLDLVATVVGLGLCLSFTYWCADFSLVQRLCATRDDDMLQTPRFTVVAKLVMPLLLILPGLGLARFVHATVGSSWDMALPLLLQSRYVPLLAAFALATLCASCFMGVAGNLIAAAAIYSASVVPVARLKLPVSDRSLLVVLCAGSAVVGLCSFQSRALMESLQLTFSMLNVPVACVLLAGIFSTGLVNTAGTPALLTGTIAGFLNWRAASIVRYGSPLNESFYGAVVSATATVATLLLYSSKKVAPHLQTVPASAPAGRTTYVVAAGSFLLMLLLYLLFL